MLIDFFYTLRTAKLPVSVKEYLTLLEALQAGVVGPKSDDAWSLDDFYNIAMIVTGRRDGSSWLRRGAELEAAADRRRDVHWGPRTLDVDVIAVRDDSGRPVFRATDELTLPHPRMRERAFVLAPLAEIAPELVIPGRGPVTELLAACADQRVHALARQQ